MSEPSVIKLDISFDVSRIMACLPEEIFGVEFKTHCQLAISHSANSSSWYDGIGSFYDYEKQEFVDVTANYNIINSFFAGTYIEEVIQSVNQVAARDNVNIGRIRILLLKPKTCYTLHKDPEEFRYHIPLKTNLKCFFVNKSIVERMPDVGMLYKFQTKDFHTAVNASFEERLHLVFDTYEK